MGAGGHGAVRPQEAGLSAGYHAPPPGSRSGVADYAEKLHRAMARFGPPPRDLYHIGNNRLHAEIYRRALERPGVVLLHDAVLHHFLLGSLSRGEYVAEFVYNYGEWRRHLAEELWDARGGSGIDPRYFEFPTIRRLVERAAAVIVHNPGAARIVRAHGDAPVHIVPHFFEDAGTPHAADVVRYRADLGVGPGDTLFGIFGYLRETKRLMPSIAAFRRLHAVRPDTKLLLAGEPVSSDLKRLLEMEAARPGIVRRPHLSDSELDLAIAAIDCCVNLRYPAAGETSGIAIRAMGAGKPVVLTDAPESSDVPADACLRVLPGIGEEAELFEQMALVAAMQGVGRDIGLRARGHVLRHHGLEGVAARVWEVILAG